MKKNNFSFLGVFTILFVLSLFIILLQSENLVISEKGNYLIYNLKKQIGFDKSIAVYEFIHPTIGFDSYHFNACVILVGKDDYAILIDECILNQLPDSVAITILTHELGHIVLGHPNYEKDARVVPKDLMKEASADSFAISLAGEYQWVYSLQSCGVLEADIQNRLQKVNNLGRK